MSLFLSANKNKKPTSSELLDSYLKNACEYLNNMSAEGIRSSAKHFVESYAQSYGEKANKELLTGIKKEDIQKKEQELKNEAKKASSRTKANYALNAELYRDEPTSNFGLAMGVIPGIVCTLSSLGHNKPIGVAVGLAGIGAAVGGVIATRKLQKKFESKTPEEKREITSYMEVKHAQWALKQLKNQIRKESRKENRQEYKKDVQQLFAAGLGNPGGMITPLALQQKKSGGR